MASLPHWPTSWPPLGSQCGLLLLFQTSDNETTVELAMLLVRWALFWGLLFYSCVGLIAGLSLRIPKSSIASENNILNVGEILTCLIKNCVVGPGATMALLMQWQEAPTTYFGGHPVPANLGVMFTSFEIASLMWGSLHGLHGKVMIIHHLIYICAGLLIRSNCCMQLYASMLMAQETSSIFLQAFTFLRHRCEERHWSIVLSFSLFALTFVIYRLGLATFGTAHYLWYYRDHSPARIPMWQAHVLAMIMTLGMVLQWYWAAQIGNKLKRMVSGKKQA